MQLRTEKNLLDFEVKGQGHIEVKCGQKSLVQKSNFSIFWSAVPHS